MSRFAKSHARGTLVRVNVVTLVLALLAVAVEAGLSLPGRGVVTNFPGIRVAAPAPGRLRPVPRVRGEYLENLLGETEHRRLFPPPSPVGASVQVRAIPTTVALPPPASAPAPAPSPQSPAHVTGRSLLARETWELKIQMTADRARVPAGDEIAYQIHVRNVGKGDFPVGSSFQISWHVPLGTVNNQPLLCTLGPIDLGPLCPGITLPIPGTGELNHTSANSLGLVAIPAGQEWVREVRVRVLEIVPPGAAIENHAHLDVAGATGDPITSNTVVVVVDPIPLLDGSP